MFSETFWNWRGWLVLKWFIMIGLLTFVSALIAHYYNFI